MDITGSSIQLTAVTFAWLICYAHGFEKTNYIRKHKGIYHPGPVIREIDDESPMSCATLCLNDISCISFNVNKTATGGGGLKCSLLGEIAGPGELVEDENSNFYSEFG